MSDKFFSQHMHGKRIVDCRVHELSYVNGHSQSS
jgi:hypothetical protein